MVIRTIWPPFLTLLTGVVIAQHCFLSLMAWAKREGIDTVWLGWGVLVKTLGIEAHVLALILV